MRTPRPRGAVEVFIISTTGGSTEGRAGCGYYNQRVGASIVSSGLNGYCRTMSGQDILEVAVSGPVFRKIKTLGPRGVSPNGRPDPSGALFIRRNLHIGRLVRNYCFGFDTVFDQQTC